MACERDQGRALVANERGLNASSHNEEVSRFSADIGQPTGSG